MPSLVSPILAHPQGQLKSRRNEKRCVRSRRTLRIIKVLVSDFCSETCFLQCGFIKFLLDNIAQQLCFKMVALLANIESHY